MLPVKEPLTLQELHFSLRVEEYSLLALAGCQGASCPAKPPTQDASGHSQMLASSTFNAELIAHHCRMTMKDCTQPEVPEGAEVTVKHFGNGMKSKSLKS